LHPIDSAACCLVFERTSDEKALTRGRTDHLATVCFLRNRERRPLILTFKLDQGSVKMNQITKCLDQRPVFSEVTFRTHRQTNTGSSALPGPLQLLVTALRCSS